MNKVVFVNRYFYPDHSAGSQLLSDLAFYLAEQGSHIRIVTSRQRYDEPNAQLSRKEKIRSVHVERVWTTRFGRQNLIGRAFDYLTFYASAGWRLVWLLRPGDIVVAKTDPPLISVVAALASKLRGARLINWLQDVYPEVATELGLTPLRGPLGVVTRLLRNFSLHVAVRNVVLGRRMSEFVAGLGARPGSISVIYNWADEQVIRPLTRDDNSLRQEWDLTEKFIVGYSGNFGRAHEFCTILAAAEQLQHDSTIVFLFIGGGSQRSTLEREASRRRLTNVIFKPYQPRERIHLSLTLPDVHLVSLNPKLEGLIVPSKFYGAAAAGRPVAFIGDPAGEIPMILDEFKCGQAFVPGDYRGLAKFLTYLSKHPEALSKMGKNARNSVELRFTMKAAFGRWQEALSISPPNR